MTDFDTWPALPQTGPPARDTYSATNGPTCPLPVIRDDNDERTPYIEACGEVLEVHVTSGGSLDFDAGLGYMVEDQRLVCRGGHVLLIADTEDRETPLTPALVATALGNLEGMTP